MPSQQRGQRLVEQGVIFAAGTQGAGAGKQLSINRRTHTCARHTTSVARQCDSNTRQIVAVVSSYAE